MDVRAEAVVTLDEQLGAGGTQALLTTLQRLSLSATPSCLQRQNRVKLCARTLLQGGVAYFQRAFKTHSQLSTLIILYRTSICIDMTMFPLKAEHGKSGLN